MSLCGYEYIPSEEWAEVQAELTRLRAENARLIAACIKHQPASKVGYDSRPEKWETLLPVRTVDGDLMHKWCWYNSEAQAIAAVRAAAGIDAN